MAAPDLALWANLNVYWRVPDNQPHRAARPAPPSGGVSVNRLMKRLGINAALASSAVLAGCSDSAPSEADLVLVGGRVITLDAENSVAEAVAVRGETVVAVGTAAEIEALAGPGTRRIDLDGRAVTPGLMDAHVHFASGGANRLYRLDMSYPNVENIADVQAMVAEQVGRVGEGHGSGHPAHSRARSRRTARRHPRPGRRLQRRMHDRRQGSGDRAGHLGRIRRRSRRRRPGGSATPTPATSAPNARSASTRSVPTASAA